MMLKFQIALTVAIAVFCVSVKAAEPTSSAPATQSEPIHIHKIAEPLTIDGDLSKPQGKAVEPIRVDYIFSKTGVLSESPRMTARYLWDDHYFYIAYEFFSKN